RQGQDAPIDSRNAAERGLATSGVARQPLFSLFSSPASAPGSKSVPLVVSSTVHVTIVVAAIAIATFGLTPKEAMLAADAHPAEPMRLVFLATPGPGGGGGGCGLLRKAPPAELEMECTLKGT